MKLYKKFLEEVVDIKLEYTEEFFFTYKIEDTHIYLENVYINKEKREQGIMKDIFETIYDIAKENDLKFVTSSICKNAKKEVQERTHYILNKNNFKEYDKDDYMVYYSKEIL